MLNWSKKNIIIAIVVVVTFVTFVFVWHNGVRSQGVMPGTFYLKDANSAIEVGRSVANSELAEGVKFEDVKLTDVQVLSNEKITNELRSQGFYTDESTALKTQSNVWVVTFSGSFSPKRYPKEQKPMYSTIIVYLNQKDGSVLGVTMLDAQDQTEAIPYPIFDDQRKKAATPYPNLEK